MGKYHSTTVNIEQYDEEIDAEKPQLWLEKYINDLIALLYKHDKSYEFMNQEEQESQNGSGSYCPQNCSYELDFT